MAPSRWPLFGFSAIPGRFYRPSDLPSIYKAPPSPPGLNDAPFSSFSSFPLSFWPPLTPLRTGVPCTCTAPFISLRNGRAIRRSGRAANVDSEAIRSPTSLDI
ncbi:hypothetical protein NUU61_007015 [Penicillium alfredii]|uniref:Uncharacterized protein n=1 Tax=Penicillium alfredii TaxID=1506179 RepID=A0A9W9K459_9EURO|nr:uncharacterized protein NUU61_007015 [Penicillium alfredii]KAJ5092145.1 hypothetical protein NUU61_007015 [Penicillium alfredii]